MKHIHLIFPFLVFLFACDNTSQRPTFEEIPTSCQEGGESNLFVTASGKAYLSWVEYLNDSTDALMISELIDEKWAEPQQISSGTDWFVNWADFPSMAGYKDDENTLVAHWLQKSANGVYDYDVHISQSSDNGKTWSPSFIPHKDSILAEHGFVSMVPLDNGHIFATWLDGRNTKVEGAESHGHEHGHGAGAMMIRAAEFDKSGKLYNEAELDDRVCDCCQTDATLTDKGVIVAYRDRSENEIRDISIVRNVDGNWTEPKTVYNDNWKIAGCPVNGPSIDAKGNHVAIAWYTIKDEKPEVKVSFSTDSGSNFNQAMRIDEGNPLGRTDIIHLNETEVLVTWIESRDSIAEIRAVRMNENGKIGESFLIKNTAASRKSGFPRMVGFGDGVLLSWTEVGELSAVGTGVLRFD